ncbi:MAG: adenylate/guanylate cyclase domain-containing protein [Candidatus Binatia bacterium]
MRCQACQHPHREGARFCEQCGTRLPPQAAPAEAAERRLLTVMFCDLVDSTALSHRLDPEELRDLVRAYHELCAREIERVGARVGQYLGDGVLAFFGYPVAREQDAQAAVRAGLAIVRAMRAAPPHSLGERLAVRVGIHTGLVVAGEVGIVGRREMLAIGSTPNVAARVQGVAPPDRVVVSETTHRLVDGFFECVDRGPQHLKGVDVPLRVYEVRGETAAQSRPQASRGISLSPLIGRTAEVSLLADRWAGARAGTGQVVLVSGEAGLGKSRLVLELKSRLEGDPHTVLECRCSPNFESTALFPIIGLLQRQWHLGRGEAPEEAFRRLAAAVAEVAPQVPDAAALLATLLSVPMPPEQPALDLSPQRRKERTFAVLVAVLSGLAARTPVLFVVEDLHWIDPTTLELLDLVVRAPAPRLLALLLFRPSFAAPWAAGAHVTRVDLARLGADETTELITRVAGRPLPAEVLADLGDKVDGVPLYVEELTKMVLESGDLRERDGRWELARPRSTVAVPMTLQESLMARLDRLAPIKEVVQLGATIGRAFNFELMRAVSQLDEATLRAELDRLVAAEVLYQRGTAYVFKHALIQDAAYESLLKGRRREQHLRIAQALEREFPAVVERQPELLAHHWAGAGRAAEAVPYYLRAGQQAAERSAAIEATSHLRKGLALLPELGDEPARRRRELELLIALGPVLVGTHGYSNPEVEQVYARARELCEQLGGDARLRFTVTSGLLLFHQSRAELAICLELTGERLALARQLADPALEMLAHENAGTLALWRGEFEHALAALAEALARYSPAAGRMARLAYGTDTSVVSTTYQGQALLYRGYVDQAKRKAEESVAIARALGHAHSLALALNFAGSLCGQRGEYAAARACSDELHAIATEQHFALWVGAALLQRATSLVGEGRAEDGIATFYEGIAVVQSTGATIAGRYCAACLAEAHLHAGRPRDGLDVLDGMCAALARCEDVFYDCEVARTRGRLLYAAAPDDVGAAEACLREALALARGQDGKLLELRAATSLASLLGDTGRGAEGAGLLADTYAWFREGFDIPALREARALLAALAPH